MWCCFSVLLCKACSPDEKRSWNRFCPSRCVPGRSSVRSISNCCRSQHKPVPHFLPREQRERKTESVLASRQRLGKRRKKGASLLTACSLPACQPHKSISPLLPIHLSSLGCYRKIAELQGQGPTDRALTIDQIAELTGFTHWTWGGI